MRKTKPYRFLPGKVLLFPKIQFKYAFIYTLIVVVISVCFTVGPLFLLGRGEYLGLEQDSLRNLKSSLITFNCIVASIGVIISFLVSILITHRFLGPVVAIKRALDEYQANRVFKKIEIRKTDEVHALVAHLNTFFESYDKK